MFLHLCFKTVIGVVLAVATLTLAPVFAETEWQEGDFVKLIARDGADGIVNNHPLRISPQTLAAILAEIKIVDKDSADGDDETPQRLFSEAKAKSLATDLSDAFRQARPNQDIAFQVMSISPMLGKFLKKPSYTAGRIFWKNKRLQIIFGSIRRGIAKRRLLGQETGVINPPKIGGRNIVIDSDYKPVLFPGSRYATNRSGDARSNWLIIDPRETLHQASETEKKETQQATQQTERQTENRQEIHKSDSIEARLRYLKSLRERDLISEDNYQYKVQQIINQL